MKKKLASFVFAAFIALGLNAHAQISGTAWSVPASTADDVPTLGNAPGPGATEVATFNATEIQFSGDSNYSLGGFLNSFGAATEISYMNGASSTTSMTDILMEFTGTAEFTNGETFDVTHDDGVNMYVNGVSVLSQPGPTAPVDTPYTYTGATGVYAFDFIYANGPPTQADFDTTLVTPSTTVSTAVTPEPSSLLLLGTGLMGTVAAIRRRVFRG